MKFKVGDMVVFTGSPPGSPTPYVTPPFDGVQEITRVRDEDTWPITVGGVLLSESELRLATKKDYPRKPKQLKSWKL